MIIFNDYNVEHIITVKKKYPKERLEEVAAVKMNF